MTATQLNVSGILNAGFGDFRAVSVTIDGIEYGCDAHLGQGRHSEDADYEPVRELCDWQDGNGLLCRDLASHADIWSAVDAA